MQPVPAHLAWSAVLDRDRRFDSTFVYAVSSTKIYCRPSCPSRRPSRDRVTFFSSPQEAEAAGYRGCLRCHPRSPHESGAVRFVEQARRYLDAHVDEPVRLQQLAGMAGCSPFHLQREFTRLVGLSPKRYQDAKRMERFTAALQLGHTVTHATYDAGFGSSRRVYEHAADALGMTPSAFRHGGKGVTIRYTTAATAIGRMLLAATNRGLAAVSFGDSDASLLAELKHEYPRAQFRRDTAHLNRYVRSVLRYVNGQAVKHPPPLDVPSTAFQLKVWAALQRIPPGTTRTYRDVARMIGRPAAARAVARACATNRIAVAIPCHRVVRGDGGLGGYRWGTERKRQLLSLERHRHRHEPLPSN